MTQAMSEETFRAFMKRIDDCFDRTQTMDERFDRLDAKFVSLTRLMLATAIVTWTLALAGVASLFTGPS